MKRVALVGSSGGNLYQLGGADPAELIGQVKAQLSAAGIELAAVVFVAAPRSLDRSDVSEASLWAVRDGEPQPAHHGSLEEVNVLAREEDRAIARSIDDGAIDGIVLVSADPKDINAASTAAAAKAGIPAAGSGGTCVATAEQAGVRFVASSGTTGTTNVTRAIVFATGFARAWDLPYAPASSDAGSRADARPLVQRLDPRPILSDALPAVIPVCVALGAMQYLPSDLASQLRPPLLEVIGVIIATFAAAKVSTLSQTGLIAGVIAGVVAHGDGLVSLLVAGLLAGLLGNWIMVRASAWQWPSTMDNILASGGAGVVGGLVGGPLLAVASQRIDRVVLDAVDWSLSSAGLFVGLAVGLLMWPMIRRGWYHTFVIPLMVFEFEGRGQSFLATADVIGLVVAAAGIAAAYALLPRHAEDRRGALHTLRITVLFGDYVEGVYPFFEADRRVLGIAVIAAGIGTGIAGFAGARGMAYVPPWLLPLVGSSALGLAGAVLASFVFAFAAATILNLIIARLRVPVAS